MEILMHFVGIPKRYLTLYTVALAVLDDDDDDDDDVSSQADIQAIEQAELNIKTAQIKLNRAKTAEDCGYMFNTCTQFRNLDTEVMRTYPHK